jgi:hypothetical protein
MVGSQCRIMAEPSEGLSGAKGEARETGVTA